MSSSLTSLLLFVVVACHLLLVSNIQIVSASRYRAARTHEKSIHRQNALLKLKQYHQLQLQQPDHADIWAPVDKILQTGIDQKAYPGAVAMVADKTGILYLKALGKFTYGDNPPMTPWENPDVSFFTLWDMASCTKVLATTSAVAQFYQRGELDLDMKIADPYLLGPAFANNGKQDITVRNCLLHNAGYPADPSPNYNDPAFGCPETANYHPALSFSCMSKIYQSLLQQTLVNPVGEVYIYSDLSFITLMYVVGTLARNLKYIQPSDLLPGCDANTFGSEMCYYEAYVQKYVFDLVGMPDSGFLPSPNLYRNCAPAWNDTTYRHEVIQGVVSDGNAYALGGISGHAGLFATIFDVHTLLYKMMFPPPDTNFLNATTMATFIKAENLTQSSRALGWDTNYYEENDVITCGTLSQRTYLHLGYTGTQVCNDPDRQLFTIFLTNRVYPDPTNERVMTYRNQFNTAVQQIYDANYGPKDVQPRI